MPSRLPPSFGTGAFLCSYAETTLTLATQVCLASPSAGYALNQMLHIKIKLWRIALVQILLRFDQLWVFRLSHKLDPVLGGQYRPQPGKLHRRNVLPFFPVHCKLYFDQL